MDRKKLISKIIVLLLLVGMLSSAFGCASQPPAASTPASTSPEETNPSAAPEQPSDTNVPDSTTASAATGYTQDINGALARTSGKRFDGITVVVSGASGQVEFLGEVAKPWEEATGAKVQIVVTPAGDWPDKVVTGLSANTFIGDLINVPSYLDGDLMGGGYIEPVPAEVKDKLDWNDILPAIRNNQTDWGGVTYGYPWDGDIHSLYYRKDMIADPNNQAKFKEQYGYDLVAPTTWDQFKDISEFFTGVGADGKQHYGSTMLLMRKNHGIQGFVSVAAAFAKSPDDPAFFFDPETMKPRINNEGFVKALQYIVDMAPFMPPDTPNLDWMGNAQAFTGGLVAMDIQWADIGTMAYDPSTSVVSGKVGYALTPGSMETFDAKTGEWVNFDQPNMVPYAAYGGWQNLVPANAQAKEAAIDLAAYLASPETMLYASVTPGSGVNPARASTIKATQAWLSIFSTEQEAADYLNIQQEALSNSNLIYNMRLPGYIQYQDALELAISKALAKQSTPQAALDEAAATWEQITDKIGRDSQMKLYKESIGLGN
jgi:multiple sugar transport system substrate-binding protein